MVVVHLIWLLAQCRLKSYDVFVVKSKPCPLFDIRDWIAIGEMWTILKFDDVKEIVILHLEESAFSNQLSFDYMSSSILF